MFRRYQQGQHFCHRGWVHSDTGIFFRHNIPFVQIDQNRIRTGKIRSKMQRVFRFLCRIRRLNFFLSFSFRLRLPCRHLFPSLIRKRSASAFLSRCLSGPVFRTLHLLRNRRPAIRSRLFFSPLAAGSFPCPFDYHNHGQNDNTCQYRYPCPDPFPYPVLLLLPLPHLPDALFPLPVSFYIQFLVKLLFHSFPRFCADLLHVDSNNLFHYIHFAP